MSGHEILSEEEMHFHLLSTIIHYKSSRNESINICSMLEDLTIENKQIIDNTKNFIFLSLENYLRKALEDTLPESFRGEIPEHIVRRVRDDMEINHMITPPSPRVTL